VLVGRDRELRLLLDTFARTAADRKAHLFNARRFSRRRENRAWSRKLFLR